jgi:hypothetical protein
MEGWSLDRAFISSLRTRCSPRTDNTAAEVDFVKASYGKYSPWEISGFDITGTAKGRRS